MSICLGAHLSISGGLSKTIEEAFRLGLSTIQFFSRNPRSLRSAKRLKPISIPFNIFFLHGTYLLNLASYNEIYDLSKMALLEDLLWGESLGATGIVVHPGSHKGSGVRNGISRIVMALEEIINKSNTRCKIILENTSGAGAQLGASPEEFKAIIDSISDKTRLGICIDTCHLFSAGFDIRNTDGIRETFDRWFSLLDTSYLILFHANDSKGKLGSRLDRHTHIGEGEIGEEGFKSLFNFEIFRTRPIIIETPKNPPGSDEKNIYKLRELGSLL